MRYFLRLRYISLLAVVSSFIGSALMALIGMKQMVGAAINYVSPIMTGLSKHHEGLNREEVTTLMVIAGIDAFLFSLVLMVFAYGVYYLFIGDGQIHLASKVPSWMKVSKISDLKTALAQVIIVIIFVKFLTDVIEARSTDMSWDVLVLPIAVVCLSVALRLMHHEHQN